MRRTLEKEIKSKRQDIAIFKREINWKSSESINSLNSTLSRKKRELKACWWFEVFEKSTLRNEIERLTNKIVDLESLEDQERKVNNLVEQLKDFTPGEVWEGYPESLDSTVVDRFKSRFKWLPHPLTQKVPKLNILMIGETGAGKSSCLNTFATALSGSDVRKDIYRVSPAQGREKSATQRIHLEDLIIDDNKSPLPCRFYDIPGLDKAGTIKKEHIMDIINGRLKIDVELDKDSDEDIERMDPTFADKVHCILYVIKATSNLSRVLTSSLKLMKDIKDSKNSEDGVRQFVIVTAIDEIGVPNNDMKNAYRYRILQKICKKVSVAFEVDLLHVIPVSNYFEEAAPNDAKNAMFLFNFWRIFSSGKEYIERNLKKKNYDDFRRLLMRK